MIAPEGTTSYDIEGREKSCGEVFCGCFSRGGCCNSLPSKIICNSDQQPIRINLRFSPAGCFSKSNGIDDKIPEELLKAGLSLEEVEEWLIKRLAAVNKHRNPVCWDMLFFTFCWIPFFCFLPCFCRQARDEIYRWNDELQKWQDEFNQTVLVDRGLFVKTKSHCSVSYDSENHNKSRDIERWIAIALNSIESERLRSEPHLSGDVENHEYCNGYDESKLCMHP